MDFIRCCVRLRLIAVFIAKCKSFFGNGSGTDLYFPLVSPTQAWNPGAGLTAALGRCGQDPHPNASLCLWSSFPMMFCSHFRLQTHSAQLWFEIFLSDIKLSFFPPGIRLKRSHAQHVLGRHHVRGGLLSSKHDRQRQRMLERMNSLLPTCCQTANIHLQFLLTTNLRPFKRGTCYIFLHVNILG